MATIRFERPDGRTIDEVEWKAEELAIVEQPNGPAAAALIAAGIGAFVLGLLTVLNEASTDIHDWLTFRDRVGPLSGKTTVAGIAYVVSWVALAPLLWRKDVPMNIVLILTGVLLVLGFIGTFPEFFTLFASD